jgi:hypothetical protein
MDAQTKLPGSCHLKDVQPCSRIFYPTWAKLSPADC